MDDLEQKILKHLKDRGWDKLRPGDIAKSIMIEGAELLEVFQWDNPELARVKKDPERLVKIKKELADVMIYSIEMAVLLGLDTEKIITDKLELVAKKYPADAMKKIAKKGSGSGAAAEYWKIKNEHRRSGTN